MASSVPLIHGPNDMNKPLFGEDSNRTKFLYITVALVTTAMVLFTVISAFTWTKNGVNARNVYFAFVLLLVVIPLVVVADVIILQLGLVHHMMLTGQHQRHLDAGVEQFSTRASAFGGSFDIDANTQAYWYNQGTLDPKFKIFIYYNCFTTVLLCISGNLYFHEA